MSTTCPPASHPLSSAFEVADDVIRLTRFLQLAYSRTHLYPEPPILMITIRHKDRNINHVSSSSCPENFLFLGCHPMLLFINQTRTRASAACTTRTLAPVSTVNSTVDEQRTCRFYYNGCNHRSPWKSPGVSSPREFKLRHRSLGTL